MNTHLSLSENKTLEVQFEAWEEFSSSSWFDFHIMWSRKTDHAGFYIDISIWKFAFYFSICDNRHWNDDENRWEDDRDVRKRSTDSGLLTEDD